MDPQSAAALEVLRIAHNLGVCARLSIAPSSSDDDAAEAFASALASEGRNVPRTYSETIYPSVESFLAPTIAALVVERRTQIVDAIGRAVVIDPSKLGAVLTAAGLKTSL